MLNLNYEVVQPFMDTADSGGGASTGAPVTGTPSTTTANASGSQASAAQTSASQTAPNTSAPAVLEYEIDGIGKVKLDEIKEWKQGYMRQSDYTRKTQDIARQKNETKEALEVYNFLRSNPDIAKALSQGDASVLANSPIAGKISPANKGIEDLNYRLASMELDTKLSTLKSKYKDFDELAVLKESERTGVLDLEFVYNAIRGRDADKMRDTLSKQIERELTDKIRKNGIDTQTIIADGDSGAVVDFGLTSDEKNIADKMGVSYEKYANRKRY